MKTRLVTTRVVKKLVYRRGIKYPENICKNLTQFSDNEFNRAGSSNPEKTKFKLVPNDLSTIHDSDIIAVPPNPTELDEMEYEFPATVDVKEL